MNLNVMKNPVISAAQSDFIRETDNWRDRQDPSYSCKNINLCLNAHIIFPGHFCVPLWSHSVVQINHLSQRECRGAILLLLNLGATLRPLCPRETAPVPIVREVVLTSELIWTGEVNHASTGFRAPDRPGNIWSLY